MIKHSQTCFLYALLKKAHANLCLIACVVLFISGCVSNGVTPEARFSSADTYLQKNALWTVARLRNHSTKLQAADSLAPLLETHLLHRDVRVSQHSPSNERYRIEGEIKQWHYLHGAASRPVVMLRLDVRDTRADIIVYSQELERVGARRQSLTAVADELMNQFVSRLPLVAGSTNTGHSDTLQIVSESLGRPAVAHPTGDTVLAVRSQSQDSNIALPNDLLEKSVAFYYGAHPPIDELGQFDQLILEPDNIDGADLLALKQRGAATYAYMSVGEVGPTRAYRQALKPQWILGTNAAWGSSVLDLSNPQLRQFLLARLAELVERGYQGVFLDTMDSFHLIAKTDKAIQAQVSGLISLVADFKREFPAVSIISNRGFEVLDDIAVHVDAVVAESLYSGWNNTSGTYVEINSSDRAWLLGKLKHAQKNLGMDVIVLDYVAPAKREQARNVARQIAQHGFIPWVANPELDVLGVGTLEVFPRKVLMLYDAQAEGSLQTSLVHRYAAMPLEYMGYVPEYLDVSSESLPLETLKGRYAGVVSWTQQAFKTPEFKAWLHRQLSDKLPVALLGALPTSLDREMATSMGVVSVAYPDSDTAVLDYADEMVEPEKALSPRVVGFSAALHSSDPLNRVHMRYKDANGVFADTVITGEFGGIALAPSVVQEDLDLENYWVIDPFRFLRTALHLPDIPQPDVTSENGKRLWLAHIDGDALPSWAEMPGRRLGAELIYDQILTHYQLPHSISIVEGEMTGFPAFSDRRAPMFNVARRMFELEHVELASHAYSHPFDWTMLDEGDASGRYNLPIAGYRYSTEREIAGSINFIDRTLAPPGKTTQLMLWSGTAVPGANALAITQRLGVANMNGGFTEITQAKPSMTLVGAMGRPVENYLQVYAPIMNENIYTNDWQGPFDGYRRVIETFQMTEKPRRLKPINIYYHFYSGTKTSALQALDDVYQWSIAQDIYPVYASDYSRKVVDYQRVGVARDLNGQWQLSHLGSIRSLRVFEEKYSPSLESSRGIVGARSLHDGVYLHTDGSQSIALKASDSPMQAPHLVSSNGTVKLWQSDEKGLAFEIVGQVPVVVELGGVPSGGCVLRTAKGAVRGKPTQQGATRFTFAQRSTGHVTLHCAA